MDPLILVVTLLCLLVGIFVWLKKSNDSKLPPGSFGLPIVGETILFGEPEKFVTYRMKKYSPYIFKTSILGEKTVVICGPEGHKFLFSNEHKLFTAYLPKPIKALFEPYKAAALPPQPTATTPEQAATGDRGIEVTVVREPGFFKPEALMTYLGAMNDITEQQLKIHCEGKHQVKVYPLSKTITLTLACQVFMGINNPERIAKFRTHFDNVTVGMHSVMINLPGTAFNRAIKSAEVLRKELLAVIHEKKAAMGQGAPVPHDMLSYMIVMKDASGNSLPEVDIAGYIMGLIVAGYSNLATVMTFFMKYVGLNPDIYNKIRSEQSTITSSKKQGEILNWEDMRKMKYSWNVICETMRLVPPAQGTFREALTDFTYAGYTIPKGWKVYWTVSTTNMNPQYFSNPEKFNPSRYEEGEPHIPYTYVPFGGGPRLCPGKEYARLAILTFVHNVVMKYRWDVLYPNEKVARGMMPKSEKGLPIRLHPTCI